MKLINFFAYLWYRITNSKKERTLDEIMFKLDQALLKKRASQKVLEADIFKYMGKYLKFGAHSEFIPSEIKSETEIRQLMDKKFGNRMKKLDVTLTNEMKLDFK